MGLGRRKIGELVAVVGVVAGFIALFVKAFKDLDLKYADDGTVLTALIIVLGLAALCLAASLLLDKANLDLTAAVAGAVALGLFLDKPAGVAFKSLDQLGAGAWLGICSALIPIGAGAAALWHRRSDAKGPGLNLWTVAGAAGLVLVVIGVWFERVADTDVSYWDASVSGHALGLLLLILAAASAIAILMAVTSKKAELADLALIVSGILVGLAIAGCVQAAFGAFDTMGTGAWLELAGGVVLLLALIGWRVLKLGGAKK